MDEKRCCTCREMRPLSDYNRRRAAADGLQSRCRACCRGWYDANKARHKANVRRRNDEVRAALKVRLGAYLLEHPCVDCGESDLRVLDFDHEGLIPKLANVGTLVARSESWERVQAEILKCSVRCANCHRRVTADRSQNWRHRAASVAAAAERARAEQRLRRVLPAT